MRIDIIKSPLSSDLTTPFPSLLRSEFQIKSQPTEPLNESQSSERRSNDHRLNNDILLLLLLCIKSMVVTVLLNQRWRVS